jgi:hypothetical protein
MLRLRVLIPMLLLSATVALAGSDVRVIKVLPQLLDKHGRNALNPSLFERDAYQLHLRQNTNEVSALRFEIQYKAKGVEGPLLLRLELRGSKTPIGKQHVFETTAQAGGGFSKWARINLDRAASEEIGSLVAWRASLLQNGAVIAEEQSFLW